MSVNCDFLFTMCQKLVILDKLASKYNQPGSITLDKVMREMDTMLETLRTADLTQRMSTIMKPLVLQVRVKYNGILGQTIPKNNYIVMPLGQAEQYLKTLIANNMKLFKEYTDYVNELDRKIDPSRVKRYNAAINEEKNKLKREECVLRTLAGAVENACDLFQSQKRNLASKLDLSIAKIGKLREELNDKSGIEYLGIDTIATELQQASKYPGVKSDLLTQLRGDNETTIDMDTIGATVDQLEKANRQQPPTVNLESLPLIPSEAPSPNATQNRACCCTIL